MFRKLIVVVALLVAGSAAAPKCSPAQRAFVKQLVEAPSRAPFPCIATAETGGEPAMGPTYWTVYGMVVDIIEDYGTPAEQAAVFSGTASAWQQYDIASRFAADHGFGGWGVLTKQKCGL